MPTVPKSHDDLSPAELAAAWLVAKREARQFSTAEKSLNERLSAVVEAAGYTDDKGHLWYELPAEVIGWDTKGREERYNSIQRQRRVSMVMDEETAMTILERRGLLEECSHSYIEVTDTERAIEVLEAAGLLGPDTGIEIHTAVDEAAVRAAYFEEKIDQADYNAIFQERISWALLPQWL
jgi:hypothetical protein